MDLLAKIQSLSTSGMSAQTDRLRHVSENIANADTP
ncbi:MAG: flagellar basal body protein, partial [Pseudomonadota bacterium]|nr:flagellar basal body protein [Pseudomonadota bacterium]